MMKKYTLLIIANTLLPIFCLILNGCNKTKEASQIIIYADIASFPKQEMLLNKIEMDSFLMAPRRIWTHDSILILYDKGYIDDGFLRFYTNTGKFIAKFGLVGNGPNEYINPTFTKIKDTFIVLAVNEKYTEIPLKEIKSDDNLSIENKTILKDKLFYMSNYFFPINDTLIIANTTAEHQYYIYNNKLNLLRQINNYPDEHNKNVSDFCLNTAVYDAFYNIKPTKEQLVVAYKYYPVIDIVDVINFNTKRIKFRNQHVNTYHIENPLNVKFENPYLQYTFSYCTDRYFYLLYQNSTIEDFKQNKNKSEIHIFDWNGNLAKIYRVDKLVYAFAVSENDASLYALGLDNNLAPIVLSGEFSE
ncbi:MAG: TolB-like 6-bladed beta-propeller domain-containing protein [Tannerellaceae bacterium]|jgi:hypothetical protein|nr:TolB-like 6-bladed beta-propeller domain-containing protein [Tannerellaceae bacterium]